MANPESVPSSGEQNASAVILAVPSKLFSVILCSGDDAATLKIYDNASAASGTIMAQIKVGVANDSAGAAFATPLDARLGIYCAVTGTNATYYVQSLEK